MRDLDNNRYLRKKEEDAADQTIRAFQRTMRKHDFEYQPGIVYRNKFSRYGWGPDVRYDGSGKYSVSETDRKSGDPRGKYLHFVPYDEWKEGRKKK